jgi:hypothetical protein
MSLACSTVSCAAQGSLQVMPLVCRSNTDSPMLVSRIHKRLRTANRLVCVALITGALVMCQKVSNISFWLKLLKKRFMRTTHSSAGNSYHRQVLPTINRWRQEPRRGATISTLSCPSNEGTECYVNLKVQCRLLLLPQANSANGAQRSPITNTGQARYGGAG